MDGVNPRFDFGAPLPGLAELGRVHFVAIGGAGMSGVAAVMLDLGVSVSGSDAKDSAVLEGLRARGARVVVGHDASHVDGVDTVVVSTAIREDNVELATARARGLRVLHRAQALAVTMAGSRRLAVAGASGKTTTTSMLAVALTEAGADPSFVSGGEIGQLGGSARIGGGPAFVAEADESDGSFLVYRPEVAVVTNVQPDHLDFYGTFERVQEAYAAFAASVADGGLLVACHDDPGSLALAERVRATGRRVLTYGTDPAADLVVESTEPAGLGSRSVLARDGERVELDLGVPGRHNVLNACAAYLAATDGLGVDGGAVLAGLAAFAGARRRFEAMGLARGVSVVDDYAHNPAKVAAVVATARDVIARRGSGRLHVVFQPHLFSRTRDFATGVRRRPRPGRLRAPARHLCRARGPDAGRHLGARCRAAPRPPRPRRGPRRRVRRGRRGPRRASRARRPAAHRRCRRRDDARSPAAGRPGGVVSGMTGPGRGGVGAPARPRGVASSRSRFEARATQVRRRPWRAVLLAVVLVGAVVGVAWLVWWSPVLAVRAVAVTGVTGSEERAVAALVEVPDGTPLARVDTGAVADRVRTRVTIAEVSVQRSWPHTLTVHVVPRTPAIVVKNPQGQLEVVDREGVSFGRVGTPPDGVPVVSATTDRAMSEDAIRTAIAVVESLPPNLSSRVSSLTVSSADLVTFRIGSTTVAWGNADQGARKVEIVRALLATKPSRIDVSAPDTPVTR